MKKNAYLCTRIKVGAQYVSLPVHSQQYKSNQFINGNKNQTATSWS